MRLVVASANPDKARELRELLAVGLGDRVELLPRPPEIPDVEETGETLVENARLKATAISAATGLAALADDTGLEVYALDGAPGVYSARYAGADATYADNVAKLLAALEGHSDRRARFRTVCVVAFPDGSELVAEGAVEGEITTEAAGTTGFGYDPIFRPASDPSRTYAQLSPEEKHALSHRGAAVRAMSRSLAGWLDAHE